MVSNSIFQGIGSEVKKKSNIDVAMDKVITEESIQRSCDVLGLKGVDAGIYQANIRLVFVLGYRAGAESVFEEIEKARGI